MTMPLNYGDAGNEPLSFEMPANRKADVGFLRIFLSTHKGDLSKIAQDPVIGGRAPVRVTWTCEEEFWDAITLAVVQRWEARSRGV